MAINNGSVQQKDGILYKNKGRLVYILYLQEKVPLENNRKNPQIVLKTPN